MYHNDGSSWIDEGALIEVNFAMLNSQGYLLLKGNFIQFHSLTLFTWGVLPFIWSLISLIIFSLLQHSVMTQVILNVGLVERFKASRSRGHTFTAGRRDSNHEGMKPQVNAIRLSVPLCLHPSAFCRDGSPTSLPSDYNHHRCGHYLIEDKVSDTLPSSKHSPECCWL